MDLLYELWLHDLCKFDPKKVGKSIYLLENSYNAFHSRPYSINKIKSFGLSVLTSKERDLDNARRILADCEEKGIRIITIEDEEYPKLLKEIYLPPRLLFVKGNFKDFNKYFPVSVVGTRKSTPQGNLFTKQFTEKLTKNNDVLIVSGMAEGIDRHAHLGAITAGKPNVAFLAGGVDVIYPESNRDIYYKIQKNGAIISEKPPGTVGKGYFYHQRNRLIAGFSKCTVIVEGDMKSGAKITANCALDNNRDIFAVPSSPVSKQSRLTSKLIKDGASIIENEFDIIEQYCEIYPEYFNTHTNNNKSDSKSFSIPENISEEERLIIEYIIKCGGMANAESMAAELNIPVGNLNSTLTLLCIKDILCQQSQSEYLLKEA